jgi:peptidoglycan/xylan/chitin deacetylase (PgdA/CDA1 family)/2-polyprenyl-3-methyl-5-hydroxy-6-metoxy-1,4-benzoquinol methylase/GT2 family glycosyltransferase
MFGQRTQAATAARVVVNAPTFCVIIPMRNAAGTIQRPLTSLRRQRRAPSWTAIIIDDGSSDDSAEIARRTVADDTRFSFRATFPGPSAVGAGVSAARNLGLEYATNDWLLFLDADDTLAPGALAALAASIQATPQADVHVGHTRWIDMRGAARPYPRADLSDPFRTLSRQSGFALHSAIIRRSIAKSLGGFDLRLGSSEDWDFWMRVARTGATFATIEAHVANYYATAGSLSRSVQAVARNHLTVLARGAQPDPRLPNAAVLDADDLAYHQLAFLIWSGARAAAAGLDPIAAFDHVSPPPRFDLDPDAAGALMADAMISFKGDAAQLRSDWPRIGQSLDKLLTRAFPEEEAARVRGLAYFEAKRRVFAVAEWGDDETVGSVVGARREAGELAHAFENAECIFAQVARRGRTLGFAIAPQSLEAEARPFAAWAMEAADATPPRLALEIASRTLSMRSLTSAARVLFDPSGYGLRARRFDLAHVRTLAGHRVRRALRVASAAALGPTSSRRSFSTQARNTDVRRPTDVRTGSAWDAFFDAADPWNYDSAYEVEKYEHALSLLPNSRPARALELACAEGHFTERLAPRVDELIAVDISGEALARARARTGGEHVQFARADLFADALPKGPFDVVFCAEVLYYAPNLDALAALAARISEALSPGGRVILAHANLVGDDPTTSGFDWDHSIGSATIGAVFGKTPGLSLAHEIVTPLYRVHAFVRGEIAAPVRVDTPISARLSPRLAQEVMWDGAVTPRTRTFKTHSSCATPILMYHRVTETPHPGLERYAVTKDVFHAQMRLLRRHGFWTPSLAEWGAAIARCQPLPGRAIILTFDDGYVDFADNAWPILQHHSMGATLFVVTDKVGGVADWDGVETPLLDWQALARLREQGLEIGAHGASHTRLTRAPISVAATEGKRARAALNEHLGVADPAFCYPHGGGDAGVRAAIRTSGFTIGLSATPGVSNLSSDIMALPRIEVDAGMSLETFARRLGILDGLR